MVKDPLWARRKAVEGVHSRGAGPRWRRGQCAAVSDWAYHPAVSDFADAVEVDRAKLAAREEVASKDAARADEAAARAALAALREQEGTRDAWALFPFSILNREFSSLGTVPPRCSFRYPGLAD
jgi:hypothetical protein